MLSTHNEDSRRRDSSERIHRNSRCQRCEGLMVREFCLDGLNGIGERDLVAARCVQCGDVVDPIITGNRKRRLLVVKVLEVSVRSAGNHVAA